MADFGGIIRRAIDSTILNPWFAPRLNGKLRTYETKGLSKVAEKFEKFNDLFVFLNLTPIYGNKAWVVLDGGVEEQKVTQKLQDQYSNTWDNTHFRNFAQHDFERYYPKQFQAEVDTILAIPDKGQKREKKKELLDKVLSAIDSDNATMQTAFAESASDVIAILKDIEATLNSQT